MVAEISKVKKMTKIELYGHFLATYSIFIYRFSGKVTARHTPRRLTDVIIVLTDENMVLTDESMVLTDESMV